MSGLCVVVVRRWGCWETRNLNIYTKRMRAEEEEERRAMRVVVGVEERNPSWIPRQKGVNEDEMRAC